MTTTSAPEPPDLYAGEPIDEVLLALDKEALDIAYENQIVKLWGVWLSHGGVDAGPFMNGLRIARKAYHLATAQIAKREKELRQSVK